MIRWDPVQPMGSALLGNQRPKAQFREDEDFARAHFLACRTFRSGTPAAAVQRACSI